MVNRRKGEDVDVRRQNEPDSTGQHAAFTSGYLANNLNTYTLRVLVLDTTKMTCVIHTLASSCCSVIKYMELCMNQEDSESCCCNGNE